MRAKRKAPKKQFRTVLKELEDVKKAYLKEFENQDMIEISYIEADGNRTISKELLKSIKPLFLSKAEAKKQNQELRALFKPWLFIDEEGFLYRFENQKLQAYKVQNDNGYYRINASFFTDDIKKEKTIKNKNTKRTFGVYQLSNIVIGDNDDIRMIIDGEVDTNHVNSKEENSAKHTHTCNQRINRGILKMSSESIEKKDLKAIRDLKLDKDTLIVPKNEKNNGFVLNNNDICFSEQAKEQIERLSSSIAEKQAIEIFENNINAYADEIETQAKEQGLNLDKDTIKDLTIDGLEQIVKNTNIQIEHLREKQLKETSKR